jgi:hypothetical protein
VGSGIFQAYVASLEQAMENIYFDLKEAIDQFQEYCLMITPERIAPAEVITDIHQTYKHIQDQLAKISGVRQLLEGKYRQYYHRDHQREKELTKFTFLAKSLYFKFGYTLQEMEAKRRLKDKGEYFKAYRQRVPFPWFHSKRNQIVLLRNLRTLGELDYKTRFDLKYEQRRQVIQSGPRSVSLFTLSGEATLIDNVQSRMRLREHDIKERFAREELRGALTHLREVSPPEVERVIRRFVDTNEFSRLRGLLLTIQSQQDLEKEILGSAENMLRMMGMGELKMFSI